MSLYPARLAVLLGAVLGRKPGGIPPYAPPCLRLLQVHLECRANPTPPTNQLCHVYLYLLPRACCAVAPYCILCTPCMCAAHAMDWTVSSIQVSVYQHLLVVVGWGSFHRDRLSAVTREIHCAPSCALSGNCSLYAALLEWRKTPYTPLHSPANNVLLPVLCKSVRCGRVLAEHIGCRLA
jgi:hypothetical protein